MIFNAFDVKNFNRLRVFRLKKLNLRGKINQK